MAGIHSNTVYSDTVIAITITKSPQPVDLLYYLVYDMVKFQASSIKTPNFQLNWQL